MLVRHGHAGSRDRWTGDDRSRPLSARGRREAHALVGLLVPRHPDRVVSSPLLRCIQTVEPLAAALGVPIERADALGPGSGRAAAALLRALAAGSAPVVVCTHGETIEELQRRLASPGAHAFGPGAAHEKGSVWLLEIDRGRVRAATYLAPADAPAVLSGIPSKDASG